MDGFELEVKMSEIEKLLKPECSFYFFTNDKKFTLKKKIRELICKKFIGDCDINYRIISGTNIHDPQFLKKTLKENEDVVYKFIFIDKTDSTYMILSDDIKDEILRYVYNDGKESLDIVITKIVNSKISNEDL